VGKAQIRRLGLRARLGLGLMRGFRTQNSASMKGQWGRPALGNAHGIRTKRPVVDSTHSTDKYAERKKATDTTLEECSCTFPSLAEGETYALDA
jgi:hypothetical protein